MQFLTIIYMCGHLPEESELRIGGHLSLIFSLGMMLTVSYSGGLGQYAWKCPDRLPDAHWHRQQWDYIDLASDYRGGRDPDCYLLFGTFLNWSGVKGIYQAYAAWAKTGQAGTIRA